jgi:signal transduction histidine kinase
MNDLYAAVMHDVKNQLAELALRLRVRGDADPEMEIAMNASRRLSEMLLLSREDDAQLWVNADTVNPADFLEILAAEYGELFPAVDISVDAGQAPACAFFDDALVRMALGNALHNACRFAGTRVRLSAFDRGGMLVLEIGDDGPGFPEGVLNSGGRLPMAVSGSGTGLGLYLAHKIAGLHKLDDRQGHVELRNGESGGLFRMVLP